MLDSDTKRKIDTLRNILVGKIPDPKSQVEQITTGMIYKFMHDMDQESLELGGVASFFVGDFEKFSWTRLFDPKLSGVDKVLLYDEAINKMYTNPTAPQMFREIFKNSYLPFRDPSTLNMFLKEINEFHYSHSEKLGDAFEYLLSFMGSQGDAGQFRTPRHIIDFIVEIVKPQKQETILDPACGTAGFLISSFKHILNQNTDQYSGDRLSAEEHQQVGKNLMGYDIDPNMTRISLVNMYLHQFASPQIYEYDTLSSEDRWNEYYDVILANPPFFSPKGGITPHQRFGVQSKRAEVLFVDYIIGHLNPDGRGGIIIPEGVIFSTGKPYKALRKKLIENCLVGVISLPAGVFNPYSAVKTSILILDKKRNLKSGNIFFTKIENDGFSLGKQRTAINKNDIPNILSLIHECFDGSVNTSLDIKSKEELLSDSVYSLSYSKKIVQFKNTIYPIVELGEICDLYQPKTITQKDLIEDGQYVVYGANGIIGRYDKYNHEYQEVIITCRGNTCGYVNFSQQYSWITGNAMVCSPKNETQLSKTFLYYFLLYLDLNSVITGSAQPQIIRSSIEKFSIPLPPINVQQEIIDELESYQNIIDGCKQVIENFKPIINIDPFWEMVNLNFISTNLDYVRVPIKKSNRKEGKIPYYGASGVIDFVEGHLFDEDLLLISEDGANLKDRNYPIAFSIFGKTWVNNHAHVLRFDDMRIQKFIEFYFNQISVEPYLTGSAQPKLNQGTLNNVKIPFPPIEQIDVIVKSLQNEVSVVTGNKKLIEIYTLKIQNRINKVLGGEGSL